MRYSSSLASLQSNGCANLSWWDLRRAMAFVETKPFFTPWSCPCAFAWSSLKLVGQTLLRLLPRPPPPEFSFVIWCTYQISQAQSWDSYGSRLRSTLGYQNCTSGDWTRNRTMLVIMVGKGVAKLLKKFSSLLSPLKTELRFHETSWTSETTDLHAAYDVSYMRIWM